MPRRTGKVRVLMPIDPGDLRRVAMSHENRNGHRVETSLASLNALRTGEALEGVAEVMLSQRLGDVRTPRKRGLVGAPPDRRVGELDNDQLDENGPGPLEWVADFPGALKGALT